ncbi:unnamed protein product [Prunus brigantina]
MKEGGCNQIKMAPEDQEKTAFRTPKGIYCYTVMPFGLKNVGATYQRAMTAIFNDMLHNTIELTYILVWDQACQNALENIKQYMLNPPDLMAPIKVKPLILYIEALELSLGALLSQHNEDGKENALYYLSRTLMGAEQNYTPIKKVYLALVFAVFTTEALTWGKATRVGLVFITPSEGLIPYSLSLLALCSNNVTEYEALIIGLEIALEMYIDCLQAYGDSQLVVR